jgi:hypothetical protein
MMKIFAKINAERSKSLMGFVQKGISSIDYRYTTAVLGITAARVGHGWLDILSWLCLGSSVAVIVYAYYFAITDK